ncbi:phenylalanine--tRNA ligase subunit alpha [Nitrospirillum viridazoti]|uniref:Phenylalanine--tRNA ligase alpha subunit n=2 Tax=Nitrospirillum TaxID=1543705 RepID=A0A248JMM2_9PROT|nr:phenylalanine--tRNA ligase subunit alpha [Nitrospirillum amazonense]ASG19776.1 phenylalanine--tRNA ligase subunit alpha [Nitrospirillum amazonense CBAmc]TWB27300.1 phenylalanyl-tRNA synthetase alpha subunit [Nitrospirillum amazonense]TWB47520.1 phenylalanyl-tRNA synthetase alpha subunit [Nitrospirillum amazonense]
MNILDSLKADLLAAAAAAPDLAALEEVRVDALGKKGRITGLMKDMGSLTPDERRERGQALNAVKEEISQALDARRQVLKAEALAQKLEAERIDVSLPARPEVEGRVHPISQTVEEMIAIFADMGFSVAEGPDIETDFNNFTALNIPPEHPARQMHDTFYLPNGPDGGTRVLRTHTSPVQIRTMLAGEPPIRIIAPGRTYRSDYDQTHTPMFHQIEGLVIGENIHMGHLKGTLLEFCRAFFQVDDLPLRFRPSFFPFTEPSAEVDIGCSRKGGELKLGNYGDWLEILGCGMVHPKVLENCGIDSTRWQGFAFGMGIERVAMLKYGIPDLRTFFEADLRWLKHYGFVPLDVPSLAQGLTR